MSIKRLIPILLFMFLVAIPSEARRKKNESNGNAIITFKTETHNFGIISADAKSVSTEFEFINTGNAPLIIDSATADCGCTRPQFPKNPIAPGKSGKIKVTFLPKGYVGSFSKNVKIKSNGSKKMKVLKISGTVNPNKEK